MKYAAGQRWRCSRASGSFDFVIVGPAGSGKKVCRIVCTDPECSHRRCGTGTEQVYSHKHLKKYAVLVEGT